MRVAFGCDHAGFELKAVLLAELRDLGHEVVDMGTDSGARADYTLFANRVAEAVGEGRADLGVLVCGTGIGMAMAANKHDGVRAASVTECFSARMARRHNDANILCLGARVVGAGLAVDLLRTWLAEEFEGGRHVDRLEMMLGGYRSAGKQ